ncbi:methyltransferase domain-containing protein [Candidatus Woesearchaeota archaeon]|nr:methyltransferase domain-containing protein [Candidatus Woesearchaeota archaeon]
MPKILIRKAKKEYVKELDKEVTISKPRYYFVEDPAKDYHTSEGIVTKKDLKKKDGSLVKTNTGKEFFVFSASFTDRYRKIKRLPQIIPLKDIGHIIAETGVGKQSRAVDAGTGSGALACFLGHLVKEVTSYEIRKEHADIARENVKNLGLKNVKIKNKDIYRDIDEREIDILVLDLPEPWNAIRSAEKALKVGGFLVSYSPTIPQVMDFANTISSNPKFIVLKTIEVIERNWDVYGRKVRPNSSGIGHSGFLTFVRKIS